MAKLTLADVVNLQNEPTAVGVINANSALIETALENTLSRDGTTPNSMSASLDMNSNRILNLPAPIDSTEPLRLGDILDYLEGDAIGAGTASLADTGTSGHTVPFLDGANAWSAAQTYTANSTWTYTDAGATAGPILTLERVSSSPTSSDVIGALNFWGRDTATNSQLYGTIAGVINSATSTAEYGQIYFSTVVNGATGQTQMVVGDGVSVNNSTASTSSTTGALRVTGGLGVAGSIHTAAQFTGTSSSTGYAPFVGINTDAGSSLGPYVILYRNSASQADGDNLGAVSFWGNSSTGVQRTYSTIYSNARTTTNAAENGAIYFNNTLAGTGTIEGLISNGWSIGNVATLGAVGSLRVGATKASSSVSTGALVVDGGAGVAGNVVVGGFVSAAGVGQFNATTAVPAGGSTSVGIKATSTTNFGVFFGSGAPTLSAAKGSFYLRSDGSTTNNRAYINTDGGTTWTNIGTAV
jgi:hypothetical protein